jgi:hypothetical protein
MKTFACAWGTEVVLITIVCILIILGTSIVAARSLIRSKPFKEKNRKLMLITPVVSILLWVVVAVTICYVPLTLSIENDSVCINQVKGKIIIPKKDIVEIKRYVKADGKHTIRKFGSGGAFGFLGKFENQQLGDFSMYVMDRSCMVMIKTCQETYVVSCKDSDLFIESMCVNGR